MERLLCIFALFPLLAAAQQNISGPHRKIFTPSGGSPTLVQDCSFNSSSSSASSVTCTMGAAITAGNQLYACVSSSGAGPITITWSGDSGTFTADPGAGTAITSSVWGSTRNTTCVYVPSASGGGTTLTATATLSYPQINAVEVHGGVFDQSDNSVHGSGTTGTSGSITPTANNSLLIGFVAVESGTPTFTAGTNVAWTLSAHPTVRSTTEYFTQTTAASVDAQMTWTGSTYYFIHIVDFHP